MCGGFKANRCIWLKKRLRVLEEEDIKNSDGSVGVRAEDWFDG